MSDTITTDATTAPDTRTSAVPRLKTKYADDISYAPGYAPAASTTDTVGTSTG